MNTSLLHAGFDGLRITVDAEIPNHIRKVLFDAKERALDHKQPIPVALGDMDFAVRHTGNRAFSMHTGDYGSEFFLHDPEYPSGIGPAITMDFRAFFLALAGLEGAQAYFYKSMAALEVSFVADKMRVSRVDFAVDFLAPWFEPDVDAVILPARTGKREFREKDTSERFFANTDVTGITCGQVSNRQLTIYDKRAEVLAKRKLGWLTIWNQNRLLEDQPDIDLKDKNKSRVWRIENRVGSKCLRRRWEITSWDDLDSMIGDVFNESLDKMRYAELQSDRNRARWPDHELWVELRKVYDGELSKYRSGVIPSEVRTVNRMEHQFRLKQNVYGNLVSLAASQGIETKDFWPFTMTEMAALEKLARDHLVPLAARLAKAEAKYRFR